MSFVWDLLNHGETDESRSVPPGFAPGSERRKSTRASVYVPLFVYGYDSASQPFHQDTHTLEVSADGGLLKLDTNVQRGQKLLLMNRVTNQEQECYVVGLKNHPRRSHLHVSVSFMQPAPAFWKTRA
ncbi:MAG: hypothetical protein WBD73_00510 [Candidatus Acidiferrales bacterium]